MVEDRKECEQRIQKNDGVYGGYTIQKGSGVSINFKNVLTFKHGKKRPKEILAHTLRLIAGATYDFIITNTYGSTTFSIIVGFKDGSITTEKIADSAVTNEKIKEVQDRAHRYCFIANSLSSEVQVKIN